MMNLYRKKVPRLTLTPVALLLVSLLVAACSPVNKQPGPGGATPGTPAQNETTPQADQKLNLAVYYVKMTADGAYLVREVHQVPYTKEVARAAMEELINANPVTPGAARVLPSATKIRGINIRDGFATVDFSKEVLRANVGASGEELGIQSIVNTLTELPGVQKVSFLVEGKLDQEARDWWGHVGLYAQPFTRDVSKVYEPAMWVSSPAPGQKIGSPLEVRCSVRVFEGTVSARLTDDTGKLIAEGSRIENLTRPARGDLVLSMPFNVASSGHGKLEVVWKSPKDGKELDRAVIPVTWDKNS